VEHECKYNLFSKTITSEVSTFSLEIINAIIAVICLHAAPAASRLQDWLCGFLLQRLPLIPFQSSD